LNIGIYRLDTFRPDFGFRSSGCRGQCGNLPVAIGYIDRITVNNGEFTDTGAGEVFHSITADPADTENKDVSVCKFFAIVFTDKQLGAVKEKIIIFHRKQTP